jgi:hypothetical protein
LSASGSDSRTNFRVVVRCFVKSPQDVTRPEAHPEALRASGEARREHQLRAPRAGPFDPSLQPWSALEGDRGDLYPPKAARLDLERDHLRLVLEDPEPLRLYRDVGSPELEPEEDEGRGRHDGERQGQRSRDGWAREPEHEAGQGDRLQIVSPPARQAYRGGSTPSTISRITVATVTPSPLTSTECCSLIRWESDSTESALMSSGVT